MKSSIQSSSFKSKQTVTALGHFYKSIPIKIKRVQLSALALALGSIFGLSAPLVAANPESTPGADGQAEVGARSVSPYVAPYNVYVPESSKSNPRDAGMRAHTHHVIHNPNGVQVRALSDLALPGPASDPTPQITGPEYPASLACIYKVGPSYPGCLPINDFTKNATGGNRAIAIVIAFDNPTVLADLQYFSSFFGLPAPTFVKILANGNGSCVTPPFNSGWALESALDTQWAHAMAPKATIILVEACSNSYADLLYAEDVAAAALLPYGGGQVSNSWGSGEFSGESNFFDPVFRKNWAPGKPISYFFSSGDSGLGAGFPSSSPWVVSVGGTTINRDAATNNFLGESCWAGSGGGTSAFETYGTNFSANGTGPWTNFQYELFGQANRSTPDISFNADPASGAWVRYNSGWYVVGGTSLSAPAVAGIVNNAGNKLGVAPSGGGYYTNAENNLLYAELLTSREYKANFYDVKTGSNGASATAGWDFCTGVGSPRGRNGK